MHASKRQHQKSALSTSLRSEIHATDSTCSGCSANSAATNALRHRAPVFARSTRTAAARRRVQRAGSTSVRPAGQRRTARRPACARRRERMPVAAVRMCEHPLPAVERDPARDVRVADDVGRIVEHQPIRVIDAGEGGQRHNGQTDQGQAARERTRSSWKRGCAVRHVASAVFLTVTLLRGRSDRRVRCRGSTRSTRERGSQS